MTLKSALRACGYTTVDLWNKLKARGCNIGSTEFQKICNASAPDGGRYWSVVLTCLDDMGIDW